jgi:Lantibiotic biosynthesis dehydratase C-term
MSINQVNQWLQLNVGLVRANASALASARALFERISLLVEKWRDLGRLKCYFFMRKSPDVRMRFLMRDRALKTMLELSQCLETLQVQGKIGDFFFSDYPAEIARFGGLEAMECVHEYFDRDSVNWFKMDCLSQQQQPTLAPEILLPAVFDDLFGQTFIIEPCDPKVARLQVIDPWLALAAMTPLDRDIVIPQLEFPALNTLAEDATTSPEVARILSIYREANQNLARGLISLHQRNLLIEDLSIILATVALFNFNRHGFGGDRSSLLVASVIGGA